jgi:hypothetical protein
MVCGKYKGADRKAVSQLFREAAVLLLCIPDIGEGGLADRYYSPPVQQFLIHAEPHVSILGRVQMQVGIARHDESVSKILHGKAGISLRQCGEYALAAPLPADQVPPGLQLQAIRRGSEKYVSPEGKALHGDPPVLIHLINNLKLQGQSLLVFQTDFSYTFNMKQRDFHPVVCVASCPARRLSAGMRREKGALK